VAYETDIVDGFDRRRPATFPAVTAAIGMVVEDRASGFCGDIVRMTSEAVTLRDRRNGHRHFTWKPGGFLYEGVAVTLTRPAVAPSRRPAVTASGSVATVTPAARTARASRIWVEGRHDAELVEHVWGDDLRDLGLVVEPMHGIDHVAAAVAEFAPSPGRRLGVLVDHLVPGSKESQVAGSIAHEHVLVRGHPFVDVWAGVRPRVLGLSAWPDVPRGVEWKAGLCAALGTDVEGFWPRLRNRVRSYADLEPELVGAMEELIDFTAQP
jgi:hypothetical protein